MCLSGTIVAFTPTQNGTLHKIALRCLSYSFELPQRRGTRPLSFERPQKTELQIEKFRCRNSNLNLLTIKNGFCRFSYPQDRLHIQNRIQAQFWNPWVMPVTMVCLYSATTQYTWRTSTQRDIRLAHSGKQIPVIRLAR